MHFIFVMRNILNKNFIQLLAITEVFKPDSSSNAFSRFFRKFSSARRDIFHTEQKLS